MATPSGSRHAKPSPRSLKPRQLSKCAIALSLSSDFPLNANPFPQKANLADIFTGRLLSEIPKALSYLLTSLLKCPNLHTVDLSDNAFGLNTVAPLQPFLSEHTPLQHLILNNNGLGPAAGTLVAEALTRLAHKKSQARQEDSGSTATSIPDLETVVCGRNRLESGSMNAWRAAYEANNKLKTVKMVQNGIRQDGIVTLIRDGLYHCTELEVLDFQDNTFTETGSQALAEVLVSTQWGKLRELGVGDCLLGANGGIAVGEALGQGQAKGIEILRLQYNDIDEEGLRALVDAAKNEDALPVLKRVEIMGNEFDEDDEAIDELRAVLNKRRNAAGASAAKFDRQWGVQVDDEDEDDEVDGEDEDQDEVERKELGSRALTEADENEAQNVAQDDDKDGAVEALTDKLGATEIK